MGENHVIALNSIMVGEFPAYSIPPGFSLLPWRISFTATSLFHVFQEPPYHFALSNVEVLIWRPFMGALDRVKYSWIRAPGWILPVSWNHGQRHTQHWQLHPLGIWKGECHSRRDTTVSPILCLERYAFLSHLYIVQFSYNRIAILGYEDCITAKYSIS